MNRTDIKPCPVDRLVLDELREKKDLIEDGKGTFLGYWGAYFDGFQILLYDVRPSKGDPITKKESLYWFDAAMAGSVFTVLRGWHVFRHSFASHRAAHGIDQRLIDAWMGHQTDEMRKH